jgi:hypothetical protein
MFGTPNASCLKDCLVLVIHSRFVIQLKEGVLFVTFANGAGPYDGVLAELENTTSPLKHGRISLQPKPLPTTLTGMVILSKFRRSTEAIFLESEVLLLI